MCGFFFNFTLFFPLFTNSLDYSFLFDFSGFALIVSSFLCSYPVCLFCVLCCKSLSCSCPYFLQLAVGSALGFLLSIVHIFGFFIFSSRSSSSSSTPVLTLLCFAIFLEHSRVHVPLCFAVDMFSRLLMFSCCPVAPPFTV